MTVSDNTKTAEGLGSFFTTLGRNYVRADNNLAANVMKNPEKALGITAKSGNAAVSKKATPVVMSFYHTGKSSCFGKLSCF